MVSSSGPRFWQSNVHWSLAAGWHWWRDGLLGWLPVRVRGKFLGSSRRLIIKPDADGWALFRQEHGEPEPLPQQSWESLDRETRRKLIKAERPAAIVLQMPADRALTRVVMLPMAAASNLRQVLGYDMDRLTPFSASQLYYDALILERQPEQRRIRVELSALPRTEVDAVLEALAALGVAPDVVEVTEGRPGVNLLPAEKRPRRGVWPRRLQRTLIVISLSLALAAALLPLWQYRTLVIGLQQQVDALQRESSQVLTLREQLGKAVQSSRFLVQKKQSRPPVIELLRELTAILPDNTWLERLQIKGETLQLIGQSASASALVSVVEESKLLGDAAFASPVTNDRRTGKERFVLGARVVVEPQ
ncbi:MAG TPA: PilN domain-containing protein [Candidatus Competibacteraceae bacterium]|nr:PilN domain-containing protein [Candidatus Competibacteraceae bacterium]HSA45144.1 PilN domain-containing protein [Candidatus Competibacteraceae bacterium]